MTHTTVVVPTVKRPERLARCLESCQKQRQDPRAGSWDVVVVDNSPSGGARPQVEAVAARGPLQLRYAHEPRPGISAARNRGLSLCEGEYVAFLDDDEAAHPDWLLRLHLARAQHSAVAVFGRVHVVLPAGAEWAAEMLSQSVGRDLGVSGGEVPKELEPRLGTGNSLFALSALRGNTTFDDAFGLSGGEDTAVIRRVVERGGKLVWAPDAEVDEAVGADRATLAFLLERRFGSGQMRAYQQVQAGKGAATAALWMGLGMGQAAVGVGRAVARGVTGRDPRAALCEVAAGVGKVLWFPALRLNRYRRAPAPAEAGAR